MNIINNSLFRRVYQKLTGIYYSISYSQTGEDRIIELFLLAKGITDFTYLDIGANHPTLYSNTYQFYEKGHQGVCIEPDPYLFRKLSRMRGRDKCLNVGITRGAKLNEMAELHIMSNPGLNTFSKSEALLIEKNGGSKIIKIIKIPVTTVETIIDNHFDGHA